MKKIKKIKIKVNGKVKIIEENTSLLVILKNLKISIKKVAIELNEEIIKKNDKIEIVHFIGGG